MPILHLTNYSCSLRLSARNAALAKASERHAIFHDSCNTHLRRWRLTDEDEEFLDLVRFSPLIGRMPWSNDIVRREATEAFIDVLLDDLEASPSQHRYFGTFAWDAGMTWERAPHIDLPAIARKVYLALWREGLHAIAFIEIDVLTNITGKPGRRLFVHVHCYAWPFEGTAFKPIKAGKRLSASRAFPNSLGANSVVFKTVTLNPFSVARVAGYTTKLPASAKNRVPRRNKPGRYCLRMAKLVPSSAVRLLEILSLLEAPDVVFSVGDGAALATAYRRALRGRLGASQEDAIEVDHSWDVAAEWKRMRHVNGSRLFMPPIIRKST